MVLVIFQHITLTNDNVEAVNSVINDYYIINLRLNTSIVMFKKVEYFKLVIDKFKIQLFVQSFTAIIGTWQKSDDLTLFLMENTLF